ncbi:potassium-transporting ATPase subunit KdpC [Lysobacter sp. 2RAF19]
MKHSNLPLRDATLQDHAGLRAPLLFSLVILVGFGLSYSLAGTGLGQIFPSATDGSAIARDGRLVGSALLAQPFADARYFQPRPSAANYDPMAAAGSNQARGNPDLRKRIEQTRAAVSARDGIAPSDVPDEMLTQSGSGLDPDITPAGAAMQVARVARARGLAPDRVRDLVAAHTLSPQFGLLGQPRVNVLQLNLALDALQPTR